MWALLRLFLAELVSYPMRRYIGLFCGYTWLFCGYTWLFCGYTWLFCGYAESSFDTSSIHGYDFFLFGGYTRALLRFFLADM